jgi:ABC-2 type transport system permease protein
MTVRSLSFQVWPTSRLARPTFKGALRGELSKLRLNRPTWVITGLGLLFLTLMMVLYATQPYYQTSFQNQPLTGFYDILHPLRLFFAAGAGVALLLTGSRLLAMEYDLGTIRVLLSRGTGRQQLLLAKIAALSIYALLLLVGFAVLAAIGTVVAVQHQTGSLSTLQGLPVVAWENVGLALLSCAISEFSCVLLSVTMAALLRSVASGMVLAVVFFPVDNGLSMALSQLTNLTKSHVWENATAFLYGPNLNHLPGLLALHQSASVGALTTPAVRTSLPETLIVIAAWWLLLLVVAMASLGRHDVLN